VRAVGVLSLLLVTVVTFVVGVRVLAVARRTRRLPELVIGAAFVSGSVGALGMAIGPRFLWAHAVREVAWAPAGSFLLVVLGTLGLYYGTWRIFRPTATAARLASLGAALVVAGFVCQLLYGDVSNPGADRSLGMLLSLLGRTACYAWIGFEALRYAGMLDRRARLGLAEPLVVEQIRLWGVCGAAIAVTFALVLVTRFALAVQPLEVPLLTLLISALVVGASCAMWCAFFPPAFYRRRVESRARS
jgi:hypothetical protein